MPQTTVPLPVETTHKATPHRRIVQRNVGELERYLSIGGGLGLVMAGISRRGPLGVAMATVGALLIGRGVSGHCLFYEAMHLGSARSQRGGVPDQIGTKVEHTVLIHRSPEELYRYFREFHPLAELIEGVDEIRMLSPDRAHWSAHLDGRHGRRLEWETVIINDHPNELIAWESVPGSVVQTAGTVRLTPAADASGTELKICMQTHIPENFFGAIRTALFGPRREVLLRPGAMDTLKRRLEG